MTGGSGVSALDAFGAIANLDLDPTVQAGRYSFQDVAERRILADILPKLKLESHHRVLDIGCGSGALLIPLSYMAGEVVGMDHADTVASIGRRFQSDRVTLLAGGFPDVMPEGRFDRVIAYSVAVCLPDFEMVKSFALAAANLLNPGGRMLLGDMPNRDRQARYRDSDRGRAAEREWAEQKEKLGGDSAYQAAAQRLAVAEQGGGFSDESLAELLVMFRSAGFESYLVPQSPDLPFGHTREDIIVERL